MKIMNKNKIYKVVVRAFSYLLLLTAFLFTACADLEYTEETTRDEAWTYEYFSNGIKNLVFDVYAIMNSPPTVPISWLVLLTRLSMH